MSTARNADGSLRVVTVPADAVRAPLVGAWAFVGYGEVTATSIAGTVTICQTEGKRFDEVTVGVAQARRLIAGLADLLGPDEEEGFIASGTPPGLYDQIVAEAEADGLMRGFPVAAAPPLLPPLTAVQRAWVVAMAEAGRGGPGDWDAMYAWARRRWGKPWPMMLWHLAEAVGIWRAEQEVARDAV